MTGSVLNITSDGIYYTVPGSEGNINFPSANKADTLALLSDVPSTSDLVTINTAQTITGQKTIINANGL